MIFARIRLVVTAALFFGWLAWLGTAVLQRGAVSIVSRAQVTGATHLVVAKVKIDPNGRLPLPTAEVIESLRGGMLPGAVEVTNLPAAMPPGAGGFPGEGEYLLPLVAASNGNYRVAGLPRSPGYEPATPDRPVIYPWTDDVKKQIRGMLK